MTDPEALTPAEGIPYRPLELGSYDAVVTRRPDGSVIVRLAEELGSYPRRYTEWLASWAARRPDKTFIAQRDATGSWRRIDYASAWAQAQRIGQALVERGLGAERPLMILSGNGIEHALLTLGALHVGVAVAPVSPAYSLWSEDAAKVKRAVDLLTPGLVFAADGAAFGRAIAAAVPAGTEVVLLAGELAGRPHTRFESLMSAPAGPAAQQAHQAVDGDTIAKFLFTSGSTKLPKAVINTHRMLCCNQQMYVQSYPFMAIDPPVLVDWMPWHHTAGGNVNFGNVLTHGGTLYIDEGTPTETGMAATLRNLREIAPTVYATVPKGLEALGRAMREDEVLRRNFFSRLRLVFPAGAALSQAVKDAFDAMAVATVGVRIPMTMGLGMTETAPAALSAHLPDWRAGVVGLPVAGVEAKLVPVGEKREIRYRGPSVTPGYWRQPDVTADAFDDEGFFCSGDAVRFIDEARPQLGLCFDGRIAEDFKLTSGTWVNVGALRARVLAAGAPYLQDVVITGHDRDDVGMLVFLWPAARELSDALAADAPMAAIAHDAAVRAWLQALMRRLADGARGSSQRIVRAMLQTDLPSAADGELTDKGSINQRAVLQRRAALVSALYAGGADPLVVKSETDH